MSMVLVDHGARRRGMGHWWLDESWSTSSGGSSWTSRAGSSSGGSRGAAPLLSPEDDHRSVLRRSVAMLAVGRRGRPRDSRDEYRDYTGTSSDLRVDSYVYTSTYVSCRVERPLC